jgi:hypothetical protein
MPDILLKITGFIDTTEATVELDEWSTADECVKALVGVLRAVGYADASIKMALADAAREIKP